MYPKKARKESLKRTLPDVLMLWKFLPFLILYSMKIKEQTRKLAAGCTWVRQGDVDAV